MKFTPVREVSSAVSSSLGVIQSATDTDGNFGPSTSDTELQKRIDFKTYYGPYKRYYRCSKFYKGANQGWVNTGSYYTPVTTMHQFATTGYVNNNIVGYMETTYYVMFKA